MNHKKVIKQRQNNSRSVHDHTARDHTNCRNRKINQREFGQCGTGGTLITEQSRNSPLVSVVKTFLKYFFVDM